MTKPIFFQMAFSQLEQRDGSLHIEGYASTPSIDRYNSIIKVDSFKRGMENYFDNPVILLGHDKDKAIGNTIDNRIDDKGLRIKGELTRDIDGIFSDIKEGRTKGFSIGFIPLQWFYMDKKSGKNLKDLTEEEYMALEDRDVVRVINEIDLVEISVVNVPANAQALFSVSKALKYFFNALETRKIADLERKEIIQDEQNPFIDQKDEEQEDEQEDAGDPVKPSTEVTTNEEDSEDTPTDAEPSKGEDAAEEPAPQKEEAQAGEQPEEKSLNESEILNQLDLALSLLEQSNSVNKQLLEKLNGTAVNKPLVYNQSKEVDPFVADMKKAKYGS